MPFPSAKNWLFLFRESARVFAYTNSMEKGASLSYYTIFGLPPILVIMITGAGVLFGKEAVSGEIYKHLNGIVGVKGALQIQEMVMKMSTYDGKAWVTLIGVLTLLLGATGMFVSLQDSLNNIWCVKPKPKNQLLKLLLDRVLSFGLILLLTLVLMASLMLNAVIVAAGQIIESTIGHGSAHMVYLGHTVLAIGVITAVFACIYKYLPDACISWRDVAIGSFITAVLFVGGKALISWYIGSTNMASVYGAASTIVLILVWVFYSSQILFFGAVFTLVYARKYGKEIYPSAYAVRFTQQEIELGQAPVNEELNLKPIETTAEALKSGKQEVAKPQTREEKEAEQNKKEAEEDSEKAGTGKPA